MPKDIYGNDVSYTTTGLIKASDLLLTVEGMNVATIGALIQNVALQYSQPVQVIREIGSRNYYYFAQLPQGSISISRLVSADKRIVDILPKNVNGMNIWEVPDEGQESPQMGLRAVKSGQLYYVMHQCIVESLGVTVDVSAQFVQQQLVIRFGSLSDGTQAGAA